MVRRVTAEADHALHVVVIEVAEDAWQVPYFCSSGGTVPFGPAGRQTMIFLETLLRELDVMKLELNTQKVMTLQIRAPGWHQAAPVIRRAICTLMGWREEEVAFMGL